MKTTVKITQFETCFKSPVKSVEYFDGKIISIEELENECASGLRFAILENGQRIPTYHRMYLWDGERYAIHSLFNINRTVMFLKTW